MTSNRDGSDDERDEAAGWHEPAHLGQGGEPPARPDEGAAGWEPAGWSLPPAEPRPQTPEYYDAAEEYGGPPPTAPPAGRPLTESQAVFRYQGDLIGAQGWAIEQGWAISEGTGPEDGVLAEILAAAPVRLSKDHRPAGVMRGRAGMIELVAFDVLYATGRYRVPEYAVTAAPVLLPLPRMRLTPARFWKHGTGGLLQLPSGDDEFDTRWVLLAAEDSPDLRRIVQDPTVRGLLLGSDDGDEFWTAAGHIAVIRPDGHRPSLIEHHARLLGAIVGALARV